MCGLPAIPSQAASEELADALSDQRDRTLNTILSRTLEKVESYPGGPQGYVEAKFPGLFDTVIEAYGPGMAAPFLAGFSLGVERATYGL
jgi:glutaredoxin-related protein